MKYRTTQVVSSERVSECRYLRQARQERLPKKYASMLQVRAEGARLRQGPPPSTLLELIDFIAEPVVRAAAAINVHELFRLPRLYDLDETIAAYAYALLEAGASERVVTDMVEDIANEMERRHARGRARFNKDV